MGEEQSDRNVLVGHPERERAIAILNDAFSDGYLEVTEFEERSAQVYAARTRGDLRAAVENLPTAAQLFGDSAQSANTPAPVAATTSSVVEFDADWTTVRRKGGWKVEQRMLFTGSWGTVDLDFSNAVLPGPIVHVELQVSTTSVKIRLGPDQDVRLDDLSSSGWSSVKNKAGPPHRPGGAVIVVRGSISGWSSIVVKRS